MKTIASITIRFAALKLLILVVAIDPVTAAAAAILQQDIELEKRIAELSAALSGEDKLNRRLSAALKRPAGVVAVSDALARVEQDMQRDAANSVESEFFRGQINAEFLTRLDRDVQQARDDITEVAAFLSTIQDQLSGQSEAEKLFRRFLDSQQSATVLYFTQIRKQIRPGRELIMQRLGRLLAENQDGQFVVRESAKTDLQRLLQRFDVADEILEWIKDESSNLSDDVWEKDELHRRLKARLVAAHGAPFVVASFAEQDGTMLHNAQRYFDYIESLLTETAQGLMVKDESRERLVQGMDEMSRLMETADRLREPIFEITERIDESAGEAEGAVKQFLKSDIGLAFVSRSLNAVVADVNGVTEYFRNEMFELTDDGWRVRQERRDDLVRIARDMLKNVRRLRRELRMMQIRIDRYADAESSHRLRDDLARMILMEKLQDYLSRQRFDAWPVWLAANFDSRDGVVRVKESSIEHVQQLLAETAAIENEMANDDF